MNLKLVQPLIKLYEYCHRAGGSPETAAPTVQVEDEFSDDWTELEHFAEEMELVEWAARMKLCKEFAGEDGGLGGVLTQLAAVRVDSERDAEVVSLTTHKAKGDESRRTSTNPILTTRKHSSTASSTRRR